MAHIYTQHTKAVFCKLTMVIYYSLCCEYTYTKQTKTEHDFEEDLFIAGQNWPG